MIEVVEVSRFPELAANHPVIDVRSPGEFRQGHIPGAFNIPLFDDEERAVVGTLYKNSGRDAAVLKGFEIAGPKIAGIIRAIRSLSNDMEILVHCWRGGMRSENMAWVFSQAGYHVHVLEGGYKSYRRFIRSSFSINVPLIILGGLTGSGKTDVLQSLGKLGEQVLDLEGIACHKGSVFGALGQEPQPTNEQFENNLYEKWSQFELLRPVWIEDESRLIGNVAIPDPLFDKMNRSVMIRLDCGMEMRINRLVKEYAHFRKEELEAAVDRISEKLGDRMKLIHHALDEGDFKTVAEISLGYYDKAYEHSISRRSGQEIHALPVFTDDPDSTAELLIGYMSSLHDPLNLISHVHDLS
jgi:tRNA 2-selenouridine synthase